MRLIDLRRQGILSVEFYKKLRRQGHPDNLNITETELRKMLGTEDLTGGA
jgi:hypothetical protein